MKDNEPRKFDRTISISVDDKISFQVRSMAKARHMALSVFVRKLIDDQWQKDQETT